MNIETKLKYIDVALRLQNIEINKDLLKKIVITTEVIEKKKGKATLKDFL